MGPFVRLRGTCGYYDSPLPPNLCGGLPIARRRSCSHRPRSVLFRLPFPARAGPRRRTVSECCFPPLYTDALIGDVIQTWRRRAQDLTISLTPVDRDWRITANIDTDNAATGTAADIARWLTGRGRYSIQLRQRQAPVLPTWL
jgi:hypothetical protein